MNKKISINAVLNMIKTMASIIFPLITFPYISRVLQPENVGKINFANSIVSYFTLAATLGVTTYAIRECSIVREDKENLGKTASQIFSINVCTMIISYITLIVCLIIVPKFQNYRLLLVIQSLTILCTVIGTDWLNTTMEDFGYITIRTILFQFISLILMFVFVKNEDDYIEYACITVVSAGGGNLMNIFHCRKYCKVCFTFNMDWKTHFLPIMMLFAMLVAQTILNSMDVTMIGFMKGDYDVGLYSTAVKLVNVVSQVMGSLFWVFVPQLTLAFEKKDYEHANFLLNRGAGIIALLAFPIVTGLIILSKEIILIIGGEEYVSSSFCMCLLSVSMFINNISNITGNMILLASRREKQFTIACIVGMLVNVIFNIFLIPNFSFNGAAFATILSSTTIFLGTIINWDKNVKFYKIKKIVMSPIVGSVGIVIIALLINVLNLGLIIKVMAVVVSSTVCYTLILLLMKNEVVLGIVKTIQRKRRNMEDNDVSI